MTRRLAGAIGLALVLLAGVAMAARGPAPVQPAMRFASVEVFIDSGSRPLGAYQVEFAATSGDVLIAGIEGGAHPAFTSPPYYDPAAMQGDRVIIGAFDTGDDLPVGVTRIARIHIAIRGPVQPAFAATLTVAADGDGGKIDDASLTWSLHGDD